VCVCVCVRKRVRERESQKQCHEVKGVSYLSSLWLVEERIVAPVEETMHEKKENPQETGL